MLEQPASRPGLFITVEQVSCRLLLCLLLRMRLVKLEIICAKMSGTTLMQEEKSWLLVQVAELKSSSSF